MDVYSTRDAAKKLGIHLVTLQRYLAEGIVTGPSVTRVGGVQVRLWTDKDIERAQEAMPKAANGRKTRYQKVSETKTQARARQRQHAKTARAGGPGAALPKKRGTKKKK
jgi:DNA-binding transcriptional MerR regulator